MGARAAEAEAATAGSPPPPTTAARPRAAVRGARRSCTWRASGGGAGSTCGSGTSSCSRRPRAARATCTWRAGRAVTARRAPR
eukprot:5882098-Prymnesium_polylepis.2